MKKNILMRIGSTALVLTMMTSYIITGTYAKYASQNTQNDTARVAKFGVNIAANGSLFGKQYVNADGGNELGSTNLTVSSSEQVVAPGTQNTEGITFTVSGTPEVDVSISIMANSTSKVFLKQRSGFYPNTVTENSTTDKFDVTANYYPVLYTLKKNGDTVAGATNVTFADLATKLQETTTYDAGTTLNATYNITWKWDFSASAELDDEVTKKDTLLGDIAAAGGATQNVTIDSVDLTEGTDYSLTEAVTFTFNAVQID